MIGNGGTDSGLVKEKLNGGKSGHLKVYSVGHNVLQLHELQDEAERILVFKNK